LLKGESPAGEREKPPWGLRRRPQKKSSKTVDRGLRIKEGTSLGVAAERKKKKEKITNKKGKRITCPRGGNLRNWKVKWGRFNPVKIGGIPRAEGMEGKLERCWGPNKRKVRKVIASKVQSEGNQGKERSQGDSSERGSRKDFHGKGGPERPIRMVIVRRKNVVEDERVRAGG